MKDFTATTETGTVYEARDGIITIKPRGWAYTLKPLIMKSVDPALGWPPRPADIDASPDVEVPVVGHSLYVASIRDWRLSTPVLEVTLP